MAKNTPEYLAQPSQPVVQSKAIDSPGFFTTRLTDSGILCQLESAALDAHIIGSNPSSRAWVAIGLALQLDRPVLVISSTEDEAENFAQDAEALRELTPNPRLSVTRFPALDHSPYSSVEPSMAIRHARARALAECSSTQGASIISASLLALSQKTIPAAVFLSHRLQISVHGQVERESVSRFLQDAGYLQADPCEDPGTYCIRGEIIDVFPVDRPKPVRIELFDDLIEKIREYDPGNQRTVLGSDLTELTLSVAREVLLPEALRPRLREKIKDFSDHHALKRSFRDPVLEQLSHGIHSSHADLWVPFAYETPGSLLDFLPKPFHLVWSDAVLCQQKLDEKLAEFSESFQELVADKTQPFPVVPEPHSLFDGGIVQSIESKQSSALFFDAFEDVSQERVRMQCYTNEDLGAATKNNLGSLEEKFQLWLKQGFIVVIFCSTQSQMDRIRMLLEGRGIAIARVKFVLGSVTQGFRWPTLGLVVLSDSEIFGKKIGASRRTQKSSAMKDWAGLQALSDLGVEDLVVHVEHGIGRYKGISRLELSGAPADFLQVEYAGKDKLYVPVYRLNVVQKYAGAGADVALDRLGSGQFAKTKARAREAAKKLAIDLVQLYAERQVRKAYAYVGRSPEFQEFEASFPFEETPDQLKAIDQTLDDLGLGKVMDRLVCGDVGYGKTEVAIRAAFRVAMEGKQVAVLVPTTILAHQHEQSFLSRLRHYPFKLASVSRFKSAAEQKEILKSVALGTTDMVIGTHRLLSKDVAFKDLGLVIVDEEHRFGVEHKERLKALKTSSHVLTLSATPIPRTLHMALSGLREISLMNTPPVNRLPIRTFVSKFDETLIQRAIRAELARGGQVFFVHNRVETIHEMSETLKKLVPEAKYGLAHGQMSEAALESAMMAFYQRETQVLICTSIIESGLDVPTANTIIIDRADRFGLAQLYQIRGRVGRGQTRAYAYLLVPKESQITDDARKRLEVIQRFVELGSGFSIASHDLEIRGGGDLLGPSQSGHINSVGFDLYTELLEEAIAEIKGLPDDASPKTREPEIKTPFAAYFDESYIPDVHQRLSLYRRASASDSEQALIDLETELTERFGPLPKEALHLLWMIRIKLSLKALGIDTLVVGPEKLVLTPSTESKLNPIRAVALVSSNPKKYQITPESKFIVTVSVPTIQLLVQELEGILDRLT